MSLFFLLSFRHYYGAKPSGCVSRHLNNQQKLKHERHNMTSVTQSTDKQKGYYFRSLRRITDRQTDNLFYSDNTLSYGNSVLHFLRDEETNHVILFSEL